MTEENSTPEPKKGKKKEDWAEIEFEIGDIEFEAKGRSVVVERMFRLLLEKLEDGKLVKVFKLASHDDEEEEESEEEDEEEIEEEEETKEYPDPEDVVEDLLKSDIGEEEYTPEDVPGDSSPADDEPRIPNEAYLDPPPAWESLDEESPPESDPEKESRESPY